MLKEICLQVYLRKFLPNGLVSLKISLGRSCIFVQKQGYFSTRKLTLLRLMLMDGVCVLMEGEFLSQMDRNEFPKLNGIISSQVINVHIWNVHLYHFVSILHLNNNSTYYSHLSHFVPHSPPYSSVSSSLYLCFHG